jgi:hypothetical protein
LPPGDPNRKPPTFFMRKAATAPDQHSSSLTFP